MSACIRVFIALVLCIVLTGIALAQPAATGKIPVTTSSEEARQLFLQGRDKLDTYQWQAAKPLFEQAIAKDPGFALAYWGLSQTQSSTPDRRKHMQDAVAHAASVSDCERDFLRAALAGLDQDYALQRESLEKLIARCGLDERAHLSLAWYYDGQRYADSALAEYRAVTRLAPSYPEGWNSLGLALEEHGDSVGAERALAKYVELEPGIANSHDSYAYLLLRLRRYPESVTHYQHALAIDSVFAFSRTGLASDLVYLGRYDEARHGLQEFAKVTKFDSERAWAMRCVAYAFADQERYDEAATALNEAETIARKANDAERLAGIVIDIIVLRLEQGRIDDAAAQCQELEHIVRDSQLPSTVKAAEEFLLTYYRSRIALCKNELASAKSLADEVAKHATPSGDPERIRAMHLLNGMIALEEKKFGNAVEEFTLMDLKDGLSLYRLGLAYKGSGDTEKALAKMAAAAATSDVLNLNDTLVRHKARQLADEWAKR